MAWLTYDSISMIDAVLTQHRGLYGPLPGRVDARSNLGLALHGAGRFEEAIAQYRNALAGEPLGFR